MEKFILLLHESPDLFEGLSAEQIQRVVQEYTAWRERLEQEGRLAGSNKLADEGGKSLSRQNGRLSVVDGPFAEAKEVVGGYFVIEAADYAQAVDIAAECPHLKYDGRIELRRIDPMHD